MRLLLAINFFLLSGMMLQAQGNLIISELMYNPLSEDIQIDGDEYEFIEFYNNGDAALDISGYSITAGVTYTFPANTTLDAGAYLVIGRNPTQLAVRYPSLTVFGQYIGGLKNSGETITVVNGTTTIYELTFDDAAPFPTVADGFGFSIVPVDENSTESPDNGTYWAASTNKYGSPGEQDPVSTNDYSIVVNELISSPSGSGIDQVEIYNAGSNSVDISYWLLTDDRATPQKYQFPENTLLAAGGYLVVDENDFNPFSLGFSLSRKGDGVYLFQADSSKNLLGYSHGWDFGAQIDGVSFGRHVNSIGDEYLFKQTTPSFGSENAGPETGPLVFEQIMYSPDALLDEFIIIKNISENSVTLISDLLPDSNAYRLDGVTFKFPFSPGTTVAAGEGIVLTSIEAETFRSKYSLDNDVQIFTYTGALNNGGEELVIEYPAYRDTLTDGSYDNFYVTVDAVNYSNLSPWPDVDGNGFYLIRNPIDGFGTDPANWKDTNAAIAVAIKDVLAYETLNLYPTISADFVNLDAVNGKHNWMTYKIVDAKGLEIVNADYAGSEFDISNLNPGTYHLILNDSNRQYIGRFIKK